MRRFILLIIFLIPGYYLTAQTVNVSKFQYISPSPGSVLVTPETNIIIRQGEALKEFDLNDPNLITATEEFHPENHTGKLYLTADSKTIVFIPDLPFDPGEEVTVKLARKLITVSGDTVDNLQFSFNITPDKGCLANGNPGEIPQSAPANFAGKISKPHLGKVNSDSSLIYPDDYPKFTITKYSTPEEGSYFIGLNRPVNRYLAILDNNGIPLFLEKKTSDVEDFKLQKNGMLTYYLFSKRQFFGMDSNYQVVDSFSMGNGYWADFHDFQVMPNGHAFLIAYDTEPVSTASIRNDTSTTTSCVQGCIIQEIDKSKNVIWQWRSWDHFKITDTYEDLYQNNIPYCHTNSIDIIDDSTAVISSRHMNEITKINRITGDIIWRLGGKNNQFSIDGSSPDFQKQHDARYLSNDNFSLYDNRPNPPDTSRGLIYHLNPADSSGSRQLEIRHNPPLWANNSGNMQVTADGNIIIGWGDIAKPGNYKYIISEYDGSGNPVSEINFSDALSMVSYRAFKFPWKNSLLTSATDSLKFPGDDILSFAVKNNGTDAMQLEGVYIDSANFQLTEPASFPLQLPPGDTLSFKIKYTLPDTLRIYGGTAYVVTKRNDQMIALPITLIGNSKLTGINGVGSTLPQSYTLSQNYPNPFNPSTNIEYSIPSEQFVTIKIYDILGRLIRTLVNGEKPAGNYKVMLNFSNFSNGVYFYKLTAGNFTSVKKMILLK